MSEKMEIIVGKPEDCPFRHYAPFDGDYADFCSIQFKFLSDNEMCLCSDEDFVKECPLLENEYIVKM